MSREIGGASNVGVIGANRTFDGTNEGSLGLVGTLFFSDYLGMTSQVIRSYGAHDEGAWTYFFRPSYDSQTGHFHVRYTHVGENVRENMNRVGFIRDDDRREVDSNVRKQFWINRHGLQDLTGSINYNQFWSQSGRLRSWQIRNRLGLNFLRRWSLDLTNDEEFKAEEAGLFEKDFRNSLNQAKLTFDTRTGTAVSAYYGRGLNFDSDLDQFGGVVDWTITDALTATYDLKRVWFDPDPHDRSSWVHFVRATYYVNKDMFFKVFYQTRYDVTGSLSSPMFDLERETIQLLYVWRFFPPFGSLQLAYQEGTRAVRRRTRELPHPLHQTLLGVLRGGRAGTAGLQTGTAARSAAESRSAPDPHGGDGLDRRPPAGIARERETSAGGGARCQPKCRSLSLRDAAEHGAF